MAKELGVGIIGCGNISTTYFSLSPLFKGLKVLACADINMNAAELRAEPEKPRDWATWVSPSGWPEA